MMKYLPFLALCAVAFLPTQVEATFYLLYPIFVAIENFLDRIFYSYQRDERDCEALLTSAGINPEETCLCSGLSHLTFSCGLKEDICLSSYDATYCTNRTIYYGLSTGRIPLVSVTPKIKREGSQLFFNDGSVQFFDFEFTRGLTSTKYVDKCVAFVLTSDFGGFDCYGCKVCKNGLDFTYDCSNAQVNGVNGTIAGPKSDICIPVTSVIASS